MYMYAVCCCSLYTKVHYNNIRVYTSVMCDVEHFGAMVSKPSLSYAKADPESPAQYECSHLVEQSTQRVQLSMTQHGSAKSSPVYNFEHGVTFQL